MKKLLLVLLVSTVAFNCKPSFELKKETKIIQDFANDRLDFKSQMSLFPDSYWDNVSKKDVIKLSDSLKKIIDTVFFKKSDIISDDYKIVKISSTIKTEKNYFKIIHLENTLTLKKTEENKNLLNYKSYLNNNLIEYLELDFESNSPITVYFENYLLAFWKPNYKKWNYINYNDRANPLLFGSETAKEIIQLYFDEIFVPSKKPWNKEDIDLFYEIYNEVRNDDTYEGLDFDKFCKCKIKFHEKLDELNNEIPDEYYESQSYSEIIQKCMIYSKTN